jgi:hypothetical protein
MVFFLVDWLVLKMVAVKDGQKGESKVEMTVEMMASLKGISMECC